MGKTVRIGDLVFCRPEPGDWMGALVARATDGPYCHVQVRVSSYEVVEALAQGVKRDTLAAEPEPADVAHCGETLDEQRLIHAFAWLLAQVGREYSWLDILADGVKMLLPRAMGSRTPFLVAPRRYDCSQLAALFLLLAGYEWLPDALVVDTARCSPNDLARALGVLKP